MVELVANFLAALLSLFKSRSELQAEILVLRHQLNVLRRKARHRSRVTSWDRLLFVWLYRLCPSVLAAVAIIEPDTLIRWHRNGFRAYEPCQSAVGRAADPW
jgi:hypothetical protein